MAANKNNKFAVGQQWYCDRIDHGPNPYNYPNFWFIIVGPPVNGDKTKYKSCMVQPANKKYPNFLSDYSHEHIKKYAKWIDPVKSVSELCYPKPKGNRKSGDF